MKHSSLMKNCTDFVEHSFNNKHFQVIDHCVVETAKLESFDRAQTLDAHRCVVHRVLIECAY